ncbi:glycosyltransferase [Agrococcus citreus]|uniref:D-inositol 3-phosphate glycosyltransferase n=1 Tax=Agrococcus citreus TaxID=84643 RepID=A0ABN1YRN1_9MICO
MNRVAHIDHTVEPGGGEIALRRLLQAGSAWDATLFVPPSRHGLGEYAMLAGGTVRVVGVTQSPGARTASPTALLSTALNVVLQAGALRSSREFRRNRIVHTNSSRAAIIGLLATLGSRRRLVVHLRDAVDEATLGSVGVRAMRTALRRADGVIANSAYTLSSADQWIGVGAQVAIIESSIGHDRSRAPAALRDCVQKVGILARMAPWKGQAQVIRAFAAAFPEPGVRLQVAGSTAFGEEAYARHLMELVEELGVADRVDFLGHVHDIWPLIDDWDVCVHASTRPEPLGQNVLQYLAAARPTIATRAGGPLDRVADGDTGLLVEMGDVRAMTQAMRRLSDETGLRLRLHRNLLVQRPVRSDPELASEYADYFAKIAQSEVRGSSTRTIPFERPLIESHQTNRRPQAEDFVNKVPRRVLLGRIQHGSSLDTAAEG